MKSHLLLWFNSLGEAYEAAHSASAKGAVILELFPFSSRGHLFLEMKTEFNPDLFLNSLSASPQQVARFQFDTPKVLQAYLSLVNPPLQEDLVIAEYSFLGDGLAAAQQAEKMGLEILDIRFMRDSTGHTALQLTGTSMQCREFTTKAASAYGKFRHIQKPSQGLRDFFPKPV
jgi:hypothetical protein